MYQSNKNEPERGKGFILTILELACASANPDRSRRCPHEETLYLLLSKMSSVKIQIRLCECAG